MPASEKSFLLMSKGTVLGRIEYSRHDWPWNFGKFLPSESFERVADLFHQEVAELKNPDRSVSAAAIRRIADLELELRHEEGGTLAGKPDLLHIKGDEVWWRSSHK